MEKPKGLHWKGYEGQDYEGFWVGTGKKHLDKLEQAIVAHALAGGEAIADIGAGFGRLGNCYVGRYRNSHMVEPASNLRVAATRQYGDLVEYHNANVYSLPFEDSSLDAALLVRVFHHLSDSEGALMEIHRVLKVGGRFVFNYSNKRNIKRILLYVLYAKRKNISPYTLEVEQYSEFLFGHHPTYVEKLINEVGFKIVMQYGVGITDKIVNRLPFLSSIIKPSILISILLGKLKIAPIQFVVAEKC